jgi:hypothetical protein
MTSRTPVARLLFASCLTPRQAASRDLPMTELNLTRRQAILGAAAVAGAATVPAVVATPAAAGHDRGAVRRLLRSLGARVVGVPVDAEGLVAPASLRPALRSAKQLTDWHGELPAQAIQTVTFQCALVSTRSVVPPCGGTVPVLPADAVPG